MHVFEFMNGAISLTYYDLTMGDALRLCVAMVLIRQLLPLTKAVQ